MSDQTLRIIDANLNRAGEGLRLLEEIARLLLNDAELTQELKTVRHELLREDISFRTRLLQARDAASDVGARLEVSGENANRTLPLTIVANAKRVQESFRVLEELAKIPGTLPGLEAKSFSQARFTIYTIEQKLVARVLRQDKLKRLPGLYVILDTNLLKGRRHVEIAAQVIHGGATTIQLRDKTTSKKVLLPIAARLKALCARNNILFIVNDYLDIALESDADGLHVGQEDLPVKAARKWLPIDKILGASAETVEQAQNAQADGADYLGIASVYPTSSKSGTKIIGLEGLSRIKQAVSIPLVALGGIDQNNGADVMAAGATSVAVISAVLSAPEPEEAVRQIVAKIEVRK